MKRAIWVSVAVIAAATVLLVFGVRSLLMDDQPPGEPVAVDKQVPQRPDCPAGLDLPCLGGDVAGEAKEITCLLYTSPSPRDATLSRMPSSA